MCPQQRNKYFATFATFSAYVALGLLIASLGAAFLQLQHQTNSTPTELTFVFTLRSLGYLIGSAVGGVLLDVHPTSGTPVIATALFATAVSTALIPSATSVLVLCILCCTQGMAMGTLDTVANVLIIYLWPDPGPWMQGLHCSFAIGAVLSPLAVRLSQSLSTSGVDIGPAFYTFSAITGLCGVWFCLIPTPAPPTKMEERKEKKKKEEDASPSTTPSTGWCNYHTRIILTTAAVLGVYVGAETGFGGFILLFSQQQYGMTEAQGQYLNAVFFAALTLGRGMGIPLSKWMKVTQQLVLDLVMAVVGCMVLMVGLLVGGNGVGSSFTIENNTTTNIAQAVAAGSVVPTASGVNGQVWLWVGTGMFGYGLGTIFPCCVLQAEAYTDLSGRAASVLMVGAAIGEMVVPLVIGLWTSYYAPGFAIGICITTVVFVVLAGLLIVQGREGGGGGGKGDEKDVSLGKGGVAVGEGKVGFGVNIEMS